MPVLPLVVALAWLAGTSNGAHHGDPMGGIGLSDWRCPEISDPPAVSCSCDLPHTLRCTGYRTALKVIADALRELAPAAGVSLLDCTVQNVSELTEPLLAGVTLHGLVISSGDIRYVSERAFSGLQRLQALGLPNNKLDNVPTAALARLINLDRLDLSHNRLERLHAGSFQGLSNLTFLEMSDNHLSEMEPGTFSTLPKLQTLRLRGNRLSITAAGKALQGVQGLQELDLSDNLLTGPLGANTFPPLASLRVLQAAHNQLSSVRKGALSGYRSLVSLSIHHNQIDVLEDHAFSELRTLTQLDLGHNRIVAVSGNSLAHLTRLVQLDLAHNFLRALTADLVLPLRNLQELRLDDNDISMVTSDALTAGTVLRRLTLADNPLNCDCSLAEFAEWLINATQLPASDRATAVCTTPPSLENGLLIEVSPQELLCSGGEELDEDLGPPAAPHQDLFSQAHKQMTLRVFQYDGLSITLHWQVEVNALEPYSCDALFVYEEVGEHEVLLESNPVHCNSSQLANPRSLVVTVPASDLEPGHRYRYCLVLLEGGGSTSDEMALVLGCSDVIPLVPTTRRLVTGLRVNATAPGTLAVSVQLLPQSVQGCELTVAVFASTALLAQSHLNCSFPRAVLRDLPTTVSPYRVCATPGNSPSAGGPQTSCATVQPPVPISPPAPSSHLNVAVAAGFVALSSALLLGLFLGTRHLLLQHRQRPKLGLPTHQCFLAGPQDERQHSHYVKLHATTKL